MAISLTVYNDGLVQVSEWVIKFNGLSRTADSEVHIVHISRWFSARLQYLQCISTGDTAVLL